MKTKFKQANNAFQPIDITIRLESIEELKQFLLMSSVLTDSDAYDEKFLAETSIDIYADFENECANSDHLAHFVEEMISVEQWNELRQIYSNCVNE